MRWTTPFLLAATLFPGAADAGEPNDEFGHWSFQPPVRATIPQFQTATDHEWVRSPIDAFILDALKKQGLQPSPEADRRTLIRRLTFDLTGLPPTPDEVDEFIRDTSPLAYERLVDRLLASPAYGERWGQHWLDVVRFAETEGFEYDRHHANAWRFRDYVIQSLNNDKPYDQFIEEQVAGDEIAAKAMTAGVRREDVSDELIAAGFHRLGPVRRNAGNTDVAFSRNEVLTERTDIIGAAFLGLTVGCARCHDHMFDPISQQDYYELQAYMAATFEKNIPLESKQAVADWKAKSAAIDNEIKQLKSKRENADPQTVEKLNAAIRAADLRRPEPLSEIFTVRNDFKKQTPTHLLKRGDERKKLERVTMQPLSALPFESHAATKHNHPKTELARWLVASNNPLTARVMVNRIWQYHFGRGLVDTPNDFGMNGSPPSHPQLLDWLALEFTAENSPSRSWGLKAMHRLIVGSSTYRQASGTQNDLAVARDPDNRLLWRFNRRRLSAEQLRDSMLSVAGQLNYQAGGPSIMVPVPSELVDLLYKPTQWQVTADPSAHNRRSIYLIAKRNLRLPFMEVFDQPALQISCDRRVSSTHAPQALELLNGPLSNQLAVAFAQRLKREAGTDHNKQIELAFRLATGRLPSKLERQRSNQFLETQPLAEFALAILNLNAFLYVD